MPGTHAEPPIVAIGDDASILVNVTQAATIVSDAGAETVSISVLSTFPHWATILTLYATRAGAEKLRDALLAVLPLRPEPEPEPNPPAPEEVAAIMHRAHADVSRALRLDGPGLESLGEGLVSDDTRDWLGAS